MKQHLPLILFVLVVVSVIARITKSVSAVLIAIAMTAVVVLITGLFEIGISKMNNRIGKIVKLIFIDLPSIAILIYYVVIAFGISYLLYKSGNWLGIILLLSAGIIVAVAWYMARYRRWWVKFLKTFKSKEEIRTGDWKLWEKYFWTFDYEANAQYGLCPSDGIFDGRARVWFKPSDIETDAASRLKCFEAVLEKRNINANCAMEHIPGCIYADITAEINYKTMDRSKLQALRKTFLELAEMNYRGHYYAEYHGELGTFLFAACQDNISRAVRTEPREEYFIEPEYGFYSDEAYYFIERYPDWSEGSYTLITETEFFTRWHKQSDYENDDEAFDLFNHLSLLYFAAVTNGDKKEQTNCQWDIENIAKWLIANNETETMKSLMCVNGIDAYEESMYWSARLFKSVLPEQALDTVSRLINYCDNQQIVLRAKRLLMQWKKGCKL